MPGTPPVRLAGDGQLRAWLDEELRRARPPRFEHVPWVDYEELGGELARAAIVLGIFGTSDKVGRVVPNKVYHAMSVGRSIITSDTPAIRDVLEHEKSALFVPPADAAALGAAMTRLAGDADLRRRLGEAARERFLEVAEQRVVARDFLRAVTPAIERSRATRAEVSRRDRPGR
jgi:glycosyltransferase involved in cell wall biosynthesis